MSHWRRRTLGETGSGAGGGGPPPATPSLREQAKAVAIPSTSARRPRTGDMLLRADGLISVVTLATGRGRGARGRTNEVDERRVAREPIAQGAANGLELRGRQGREVGRGLFGLQVQIAVEVDGARAQALEGTRGCCGGGRGRRARRSAGPLERLTRRSTRGRATQLRNRGGCAALADSVDRHDLAHDLVSSPKVRDSPREATIPLSECCLWPTWRCCSRPRGHWRAPCTSGSGRSPAPGPGGNRGSSAPTEPWCSGARRRPGPRACPFPRPTRRRGPLEW